MVNCEFWGPFVSASRLIWELTGWLVSVQVILDLGHTSGRLGAGRRRGEFRRGSDSKVEETILIIRVIFGERAVEVEDECDENATKLDVVLADGHRGASRGNPGL